MGHAHDFTTQEVGARKAEVQDHSQPRVTFKACLGYMELTQRNKQNVTTKKAHMAVLLELSHRTPKDKLLESLMFT